jgi:hypothetical protein
MVATIPVVEAVGAARRSGRPAAEEDRREGAGGHPQWPCRRR